MGNTWACRLLSATTFPNSFNSFFTGCLLTVSNSGEYTQLHAAAEKGWLDLAKTRDESLLAIKRAGADLILTYFAKDVARALKN